VGQVPDLPNANTNDLAVRGRRPKIAGMRVAASYKMGSNPEEIAAQVLLRLKVA